MSSGSSPSRRRRRAAALIGRTAGTSAARKIRARRRARPGGRTGGGRRGRSSARGGRLRRARRNLGRAGGRRFSGPVSSGVWARRRSECSSGAQRSAARSRAEAAASAIAPAAAFGQAGSPGLGRRPAPGERRVGSRIFTAISGTGRGQRSRRAMTMSNAQSARISDWAAGASGTAENARAAALAAAETGSPSPAQAFRLAARPLGSTARSSRAAASKIRLGSRLGGRLSAVAPERQEVRRGSERVADGEAEVAQRGFVGVEAQDFGAGRGALQREAGAQRPGGGRIGAQECVEQSEPGPGGKQRTRPPLPFRSPAPRPGSAPVVERLGAPGFSLRGALFGEPAEAARKGAPERARGGSARRSRSAQITAA